MWFLDSAHQIRLKSSKKTQTTNLLLTSVISKIVLKTEFCTTKRCCYPCKYCTRKLIEEYFIEVYFRQIFSFLCSIWYKMYCTKKKIIFLNSRTSITFYANSVLWKGLRVTFLTFLNENRCSPIQESLNAESLPNAINQIWIIHHNTYAYQWNNVLAVISETNAKNSLSYKNALYFERDPNIRFYDFPTNNEIVFGSMAENIDNIVCQRYSPSKMISYMSCPLDSMSHSLLFSNCKFELHFNKW